MYCTSNGIFTDIDPYSSYRYGRLGARVGILNDLWTFVRKMDHLKQIEHVWLIYKK